ncbi:MAG: alpha/beta fold hydrolase [Spongiibacteraceae bacterium]
MQQVLAIDAAGMRVHARQTGEQPRAVFLHGFGGDLQTWDLLWAALENALPALRYDLRGFGQTRDDSAAPFHHADDLLAILDTQHIAQCDLIGVSMGGAVALNFALDHPDRVRNLILISPGIVAWEWSEAWLALWRPITAKARAGDMAGARQLWWQHPLFASTRESLAASELYESIQRYAGAQWIRDYEKRSMPDVDRLYSLKPRTLLLTGQRDFEDFRLIADLVEASTANVTRIDWPDCGHLLHLEKPADCAREILSFLNFVV